MGEESAGSGLGGAKAERVQREWDGREKEGAKAPNLAKSDGGMAGACVVLGYGEPSSSRKADERRAKEGRGWTARPRFFEGVRERVKGAWDESMESIERQSRPINRSIHRLAAAARDLERAFRSIRAKAKKSERDFRPMGDEAKQKKTKRAIPSEVSLLFFVDC